MGLNILLGNLKANIFVLDYLIFISYIQKILLVLRRNENQGEIPTCFCIAIFPPIIQILSLVFKYFKLGERGLLKNSFMLFLLPPHAQCKVVSNIQSPVYWFYSSLTVFSCKSVSPMTVKKPLPFLVEICRMSLLTFTQK